MTILLTIRDTTMKYILITLALFLTAWGESEQQRLYRQQQQLAQQQQQLNYQQQQLAQQQYQQPGWDQHQQGYAQQGYSPAPIVQQPAPVVIQQPSSSGSHDNTISNLLLGAVTGHAISNMVNGRNTVSSSNSNYGHDYNTNKNITSVITPTTNKIIQSGSYQRRVPTQNYMDTNKLSTYNSKFARRK